MTYEETQKAVDRKMRINRARVWTLRGDGHDDHVEEAKIDG